MKLVYRQRRSARKSEFAFALRQRTSPEARKLASLEQLGQFEISMKIALLHDSVLPPKTYGGIERIVMALAHEYTRLGHQVVIASRAGSQIKDYEFV